MTNNEDIYEILPTWPTRDEAFNVAMRCGMTAAAADAFAAETEAEVNAEMDAQHEGEIAAENAWLIHAENAGWQEIERQHEQAMGVVSFSEAYAASLTAHASALAADFLDDLAVQGS